MSNGVETAPAEKEPAEAKEEPKFAAGDSLIDTAKKLFFIADDAGEPEGTKGTDHSVVLAYPDGSMVTVKFETRAGTLGAVGPLLGTEEQKKAANEKFSAAKKAQEEQLEAAKAKLAQQAAAVKEAGK